MIAFTIDIINSFSCPLFIQIKISQEHQKKNNHWHRMYKLSRGVPLTRATKDGETTLITKPFCF